MKVIYQQDLKGQYKKGQVAVVSDGYARNFLIPKGIAIEATQDNINALSIATEAQNRKLQKEEEEALALKKHIETLQVYVLARAGTNGRIYGSVTSKEIADALREQHKIEIAKNKIVLEDTIKSFGTFSVKVKVYSKITATFKLTVKEEE